mmetsp:Transcript_5489/g.12551  ORF Transcript_5489/g.12551 Transcript_5489/m.12551 type:complete len:240 (-) Transcript_5489:2057-2776(-)
MLWRERSPHCRPCSRRKTTLPRQQRSARRLLRRRRCWRRRPAVPRKGAAVLQRSCGTRARLSRVRLLIYHAGGQAQRRGRRRWRSRWESLTPTCAPLAQRQSDSGSSSTAAGPTTRSKSLQWTPRPRLRRVPTGLASLCSLRSRASGRARPRLQRRRSGTLSRGGRLRRVASPSLSATTQTSTQSCGRRGTPRLRLSEGARLRRSGGWTWRTRSAASWTSSEQPRTVPVPLRLQRARQH